MGWLNETLFTEAVTTTRWQWRCAAMADAISIQCSRRPPMRLPRVLVSFGRTISVRTARDSLGVLGFRDIRYLLLFNSFQIHFANLADNHRNFFNSHRTRIKAKCTLFRQ